MNVFSRQATSELPCSPRQKPRLHGRRMGFRGGSPTYRVGKRPRSQRGRSETRRAHTSLLVQGGRAFCSTFRAPLPRSFHTPGSTPQSPRSRGEMRFTPPSRADGEGGFTRRSRGGEGAPPRCLPTSALRWPARAAARAGSAYSKDPSSELTPAPTSGRKDS